MQRMGFGDWLLFQRGRNDYVGDASVEFELVAGLLNDIPDDYILCKILDRCNYARPTQRALFDAWEEFRQLLFRQFLAKNEPYHKFGSEDWVLSADARRKYAEEMRVSNHPKDVLLRERFGSKAWEHKLSWAPRDRPGFVYCMRAENGACKIGRTKDIGSRFRAVDLVTPFDLELVVAIATDDCVELERQYHNVFIECNTKGEWFNLTDEWVEWFAAINEPVMLYQPPMNSVLTSPYIPNHLLGLDIPASCRLPKLELPAL